LLPALLLAAGCTGSAPEQTPPEETPASASFSIALDDVLTAPASLSGRVSSASIPWRTAFSGVSSQAFSPADVTRIRIDVKEASTGTVIYENFDLTKTDNKWSGTLPFLPKGRLIIFLAKAFNGTTQLYGGSTEQTLTGNNETVNISLAPLNDGQTITLPRITRITIPGAFPQDKRGNISFSVSATTGEKLTYVINGAAGGGTFSPQRGSITLLTAAGTFVSQYTPPAVSEETEYTHEVVVTNEAGHSVTTTFKTRVLPVHHDDAENPIIKVVFNPVINAIAAHRPVDTSDVLWKATVADDAPLAELTYAWSFEANGTFDPEPEFTDGGATNPARMLNYTPLLEGTLKLEVTDAQGGKTTLEYVLTPDQFPDDFYEEGDLGGLQSISSGFGHTCVLMDNANVLCWGYNAAGQLGYGNTSNIGDNEIPYSAGHVNLVGTATQVVTGGDHTCALLDNGFVRCWGRNNYGQLGYGSTDNVGDGEAVSSQGYVTLGGRATKIAAGGHHTCALLTTGKVRCWGRNNYGQLGLGHTNPIGDTETVWTAGDVSVGGLVKDIVAGGFHTCALLTTGKVRCWGYNAYGQLGLGNTTVMGDNEVPSTVSEVDVGGLVKQLSAGSLYTCALLETGTVRCWGYGWYGQLGYPGRTGSNYVGDNETPASVGDINVGEPVLQIVASKNDDANSGEDHTCALLSSGNIKCWGLNNHGQLGYGNTTNLSQPPASTVDLGGFSAYALSVGGDHSCAVLSTGKARCWGFSGHGELGYGNTTQIGDNEPAYVGGDINLRGDILNCVKVVTSYLSTANPYGVPLTVNYSMAGGGGGGMGYHWPGGNGATATGSFTLWGGNLEVFVGGGGGWGFYYADGCGGGGAGYYGGGGGGVAGGGGGGSSAILSANQLVAIAAGGGGARGAVGGSTTGGTPGAGNGDPGGTGTLGAGGRCSQASGGIGLNGGTDYTAYSGGGGGYGGGGAVATVGGTAGGTAAVNGSGLGANTWSTATTLPAAAGAGSSGGGNAGLVILTYSAAGCLL
jgi:alpha-tubulin suppressor-like RCC1 family protein